MKIKVKTINGKGRGVVAQAIIPPGLVLEAAPIIYINAEERRRLKGIGDVGEYLFVDRGAWISLPTNKKHMCPGFLAWGPSSLVNHSDEPNAEVYVEETEDGPFAILRALRTIQPDEEVTIFYPDVEQYDGSEDWPDRVVPLVARSL